MNGTDKLYRTGLGALLALAIAALPACESQPRQSDVLVPLPIETMVHGSQSSIATAGVFLVNDAAQLEELGATEAAADLEVDFNQHSLVVLALGERSTGGHWALISGVQQRGDVLYVQGLANRPGPDQAVSQAITHPYCIARIARTSAISVSPEIDGVVGQNLPH